MLPLSNINDAQRYLRNRLKQMGFSDAAAVINLKDLIAQQGEGKRFYWLQQQAANPNGTNYTYNIEKIGDFWHLHSIELSKILTRRSSGGPDRIISETYYNDFMFEDRKALDIDFGFVIQHTLLRDDLRTNISLKEQITHMGFDYGKLLSQAHSISGLAPGERGQAIMHEQIPLTVNGRSNGADLWVVFNRAKDKDESYKIDFVEAGTHRGILNSKDPSLVVAYRDSGAGFPHKNEITREITTRENIYQANTQRAYSLLNKIKGIALKAKDLGDPKRKL